MCRMERERTKIPLMTLNKEALTLTLTLILNWTPIVLRWSQTHYTKRMTMPMENILTILEPGLLKETTEERFNMIFAQLKVLGWKSKKSARYDWVSFYSCWHNITLTCRRLTTLGVPTTGNRGMVKCL